MPLTFAHPADTPPPPPPPVGPDAPDDPQPEDALPDSNQPPIPDLPTPDAIKQFPCAQCGAQVEFAPGQQTLTCPFCGHETPIPQSEEDIQEIDFAATLNDLAGSQETVQRAVVQCESCAAQVDRPPNVTAMACPFCGSDMVMTESAATLIKPKSLLPFHITRQQADESFRTWIKSRWFAPNALKKLARLSERLRGMYVPFWTYDSRTVSFYRGQRGDHYYVTRTRTVTRNGKRVTETYQQRKTRWRHVSGVVHNTFDDILVLASRSLPRKHTEKLEPWDLENLTPYQDEYLSGFGAESYQVNLEEGFGKARQVMDSHIQSDVRRDIGGDEQRITSINTQYNNITFKHILLPVWICAYRYHDKIYRFLVNARTGEVQGERPWSAWKIALAVLAGLLLFALVLFLIVNR